MQAFKATAAAITKEYFQSEDATDAALSLASLDEPELLDIFVKQVGLAHMPLLGLATLLRSH